VSPTHYALDVFAIPSLTHDNDAQSRTGLVAACDQSNHLHRGQRLIVENENMSGKFRQVIFRLTQMGKDPYHLVRFPAVANNRFHSLTGDVVPVTDDHFCRSHPVCTSFLMGVLSTGRHLLLVSRSKRSWLQST